MDLTNTARNLFQEAMEIPEPFSVLTEEWQAYARGLLEQYEALAAEHGEVPFRDLLHPMLLSKNGRFEEALAVTDEAYRRDPNWNTAVAVANASRRAGDVERAAEMFARALEHDPDDLTCWLEVGDIRLEQGRFDESLAAFETVLARDASHEWALPSAFYCRHHLGIEGEWLASLRELANREGCTCGMQGCLTNLFGGYGSDDGIARAEYLLTKPE